MKRTRVMMAMLAVAGGVGLYACGGGGSASSGSTISGVITGFGSVYVNGVKYDTSGASVQLDGIAGSETDLQVGMVVSVQGSTHADGTTGTASSISYSEVVEGVVLAVDLSNGSGTLNVMGQTVHLDSLTIFKSDAPGIGLHNIPVGSVAEVSGFSDGDGAVYASRVEISHASFPPGTPLEVKGVVSDLDEPTTVFRIGGLVVDYGAAALVPSALADGLYVEVKGDTAPTNNGDGTYTFTATAVELENGGVFGVGGEEGDNLHLQGVVMALDAEARTIVVNGQLMGVREDAMRDGLVLADLNVGTYIKLEAERSGGQWVVKEIEVGRSSDVELTAAVEAVDPAAGTISVMGQTIAVDSNTIMHDDSVAQEHYFDLADVQPGDRVEVDVSIQGGQWQAARLQREDAGPDTLEGKVTSTVPVQVAGIEVTGLDALGITPSPGMSLELTGSWDGAAFNATALVQ